MNDDIFPRYTEFNPRVPVWCVTPEQPGCIHRFFDTSPISPSGRYLAVFQLPFEDRQPEPGDKGNVCIVDLQTGENRVVAETAGWEPQMGANINWGGSDHELFFNDVDTSTWTPFAWKLDPLTGERMRMEGTVYHASPDGRWLISANMLNMRRTQHGYGVAAPHEACPRHVGAADDDGFWLTDTRTGRARLFISFADIFSRADPPVELETPEKYEIYGFHSKFNPQGDWLMLSLRCFRAAEQPVWHMFHTRSTPVRFAWITMPLDGSQVHCATPVPVWDRPGHHATFFPDGYRISMNVVLEDGGPLRFVQVDRDGQNFGPMHPDLVGSGHPTVHPSGPYILTDMYTRNSPYGDGTVPLRWVNYQDATEQVVVRFNTAQPSGDGVLRIDPHPAWDRTWRYVTFNGFVGGTRRVFVADMQELVS